MIDLSRLFPRVSDETCIPRISYYFLVFTTLVSTFRSLIHIFAPDGGAYTIAGLSIDAGSSPNLVAIFAQWGAVQLLLALVYWIIILRYRFLTPAMLLIVILEQLLRIFVGLLKPIEAEAAPPGAIGSYLFLALTLIALGIALWKREDEC